MITGKRITGTRSRIYTQNASREILPPPQPPPQRAQNTHALKHDTRDKESSLFRTTRPGIESVKRTPLTFLALHIFYTAEPERVFYSEGIKSGAQRSRIATQPRKKENNKRKQSQLAQFSSLHVLTQGAE
jgi:hypothetical protein